MLVLSFNAPNFSTLAGAAGRGWMGNKYVWALLSRELPPTDGVFLCAFAKSYGGGGIGGDKYGGKAMDAITAKSWVNKLPDVDVPTKSQAVAHRAPNTPKPHVAANDVTPPAQTTCKNAGSWLLAKKCPLAHGRWFWLRLKWAGFKA